MSPALPDRTSNHLARIAPSAAGHDLQFRRLLDKQPAGAYTCDAGGLITYFNHHAERLWGRAPRLNDPVDRWCGSFRLFARNGTPIPHDDCWMARAIKQQAGFNGQEIVVERPAGDRLTALAHANPIHDDAGRLVGAVNVMVDLSERERAEEERRRFEAKLLHAQNLESLGVLAGGIAHDFNNLLTSMLGFAGLAQEHLADGSPALPMLREVERAAERAAELAGQMLAYSGRGKFVTPRVSLHSLAAEMANLMGAVVSKKAALHLESSPAAVEGCPTQLRQVVMNLITNASDALDGRAGVVRVRTGVREAIPADLRSPYLPDELPPGRYSLVEVADDGCGMTPETLGRVFDPFFTTKFTGRGLGLAAVLGIVQGHRGTIRVASSVGRGTTFTVLIPAVSTEAPPSHADRPLPPPAARRGLVLVVEDEPGLRTFARAALEGAGFAVREAADGRHGLDQIGAAGDPVGVVLLDLTMPVMDGFEVLAELRRTRPGLPVLVTSGYSEAEVSGRTAGLGAGGFLPKPYRAADLIAGIGRVMATAPAA